MSLLQTVLWLLSRRLVRSLIVTVLMRLMHQAGLLHPDSLTCTRTCARRVRSGRKISARVRKPLPAEASRRYAPCLTPCRPSTMRKSSRLMVVVQSLSRACGFGKLARSQWDAVDRNWHRCGHWPMPVSLDSPMTVIRLSQAT